MYFFNASDAKIKIFTTKQKMWNAHIFSSNKLLDLPTLRKYFVAPLKKLCSQFTLSTVTL